MAKRLQFMIALVVLFIAHAQAKCVKVKPAANFTMDGFQGIWREIGKIQTAGGATWQEGCVCNTMTIRPYIDSELSDCSVTYTCRDSKPDGAVRQFTGELTDSKTPGQWKQVFFPLAPKVDWTVIVLGEDYAMTYDCSGFLGVATNYCIHIVSRQRSLGADKVTELLQVAEGLGLNTENLEYTPIDHTDCQN